ncbi:MAG: hypothetical protein E7449_06430 [Ruminococcaceae bacterium]|nr:hypothetical protein [Oscillospiraceae bacterium]
MKKLNRRGTAALVIAMVLSILLIAFVSTLPKKIQIRQGREAAAEIFDPRNIDSLTLAFVYEPYTPSPLSPAEFWPCARVTDRQAIETICTLLIDAAREQMDYSKYPSQMGDAYWLLKLNDTQSVRLMYKRSGYPRPASTLVYDDKYWDLDLPASQTLYDALDALAAPPKGEDITAAAFCTLTEGIPDQTQELSGEMLEAARATAARFLTDASRTQVSGAPLVTFRTLATHQLRLTCTDGTVLTLNYVPIKGGGARIYAEWQIGGNALSPGVVGFQVSKVANPFPDLFAQLEN